MRLLLIGFIVLSFFGSSNAQTTLLTKQQWNTLVNRQCPSPFKPPKSSPFREITKIGSYEDGDTNLGYTAHVTSERYSEGNSRFYRVERIGTKIRTEEKLLIGKDVFTRWDNGKWVAEDTPSRTKVVRVSNDPVNSPTYRKPGEEEILYYSLGERPYKGRMVSVYEEVTRHVLIRKADNSEIHYENRTRFWVAEGKDVVRWDTYYAIYSTEKTLRLFTSHELELDASIKPFEAPAR